MNNVKSLKETLRLIEGLTILFDDTEKDLRTARHTIYQIYRIAHLHSDCKNLHMDWRTEREELLNKLKEGGYV